MEGPLSRPRSRYGKLGVELRQSEYRALFSDAVTDDLLSNIRDATNKGWALGNERFCVQVEAMTARRAAPLPRGRAKKSTLPLNWLAAASCYRSEIHPGASG